MPSWNPGLTAPKDGKSFIFRARNLVTYEEMQPLVGRYRDGVLEWNNFGRWEECGFPIIMWAEIPEV
jgi:hypothetical protein